jgi:processive 1,2-diacylglycerol beta-glucosyltransferase
MPRILLLHASYGSGHVTAANALAAAFQRRQPGQVEVVDTLDFVSPVLRTTSRRAYLTLSSKARPVWKILYEESDQDDPAEAETSARLRSRLGKPFGQKLVRLVRSFDPDILVVTHFLPAELLRAEDEAGRLRAPVHCVITDFMAHSNWLSPVVDRYFVASDLTRAALIGRGVPAERISVSGIPVKLEIAEPKTQADSRARHDLPPDEPVVTIFGGGIEPARVRRMVCQLLADGPAGVLVVVAGRTAELTRALADVGDGPRLRLRSLGMIDYVDDLVAASDLVVTKAGGLIVSEVLARGTPMIVTDPIPGQEDWNADVVAGTGAGLQLRLPEMVPPTVIDLLARPERLAAMRAAALRVGRPRAALDIVDEALNRYASRADH